MYDRSYLCTCYYKPFYVKKLFVKHVYDLLQLFDTVLDFQVFWSNWVIQGFITVCRFLREDVKAVNKVKACKDSNPCCSYFTLKKDLLFFVIKHMFSCFICTLCLIIWLRYSWMIDHYPEYKVEETNETILTKLKYIKYWPSPILYMITTLLQFM